MFFRRTEGGIDLDIRLTPRGGRDAIDGVRASSDGKQYLAARVRAVPEKGAANAALEKLVAATLGVAKSAVSVTSGHTSRLKTVHVEGDPDDLAHAVAELTGKR